MRITLKEFIAMPIAELSEIKSLEISNQKYGCGSIVENDIYEIPNVFDQLKNIEYLSFCNYQDHYLSIPATVFECSNLKELCVGYGMETNAETLEKLAQLNKLKAIEFLGAEIIDEIPENIKDIPQLKTLKLSGGNRIGQIRESLSNVFSCTGLEELHIDDHRVGCKSDENEETTLRADYLQGISNLTQLRILKLWGREINEIPNEVGSLSKLEKLHVFSPVALVSISNNIGKLNNLKDLRLSVSNIDFPVFLCQLPNLESMNLLGFTSLPNEIYQLRKLKRLKLGLTIKELPNTFYELNSLESLDISGTALQEEAYEQIGQLKNLKTLDASSIHNSRLKEVPLFIKELKQLRNLNLFSNKYEEVPSWLIELKQLRALNLSHTNIKEIPDFFEKFTHLEELNIGYTTKLKTITPKLGGLKNLKILKKEIVKTKTIMKAFEECRELEELDLNHFAYKQFPDFKLMKKLRFLNLDSAVPEALKQAEFPESLQYVWMYDRHLAELLPEDVQAKVVGLAGSDDEKADYSQSMFI